MALPTEYQTKYYEMMRGGTGEGEGGRMRRNRKLQAFVFHAKSHRERWLTHKKNGGKFKSVWEVGNKVPPIKTFQKSADFIFFQKEPTDNFI